jgi:hypothetical protein
MKFEQSNRLLLPPRQSDESNEEYIARVYGPDGEPHESEGVRPMPVYTDETQCVSCWQMNWRERLAALWHGRIWLQVLSGGTQPPVSLSVAETIFVEPQNADEDGLAYEVE